MAVKAWLLIIYMGGHTGYITVNDLSSEQACNDLYISMVKSKVVYAVSEDNHKCLSYTKAPTQVAQ